MCKKVTVFYDKIILIISKILHWYYTIYMNKQLVFGVIAVVFATALIASLYHLAYVTKHLLLDSSSY